jgi:hypothetical protein
MASLAWSISVGAGSGPGLTGSGMLDAGAVTTASAEVDAGTNQDLALQIDDVARVAMLAVTCNRYDGSVTIKGGDAADPSLVLTGPIFAFGAVAQRLAASLGTVKVTAAAAPATPASVTFLIGTSLT